MGEIQMMKKALSVIALIVILFTSLIPMNAYAQGYGEVKLHCVAKDTKAKGKTLEVYFENIETGEIVSREVGTNGPTDVAPMPVGEYEYVKCIWAGHEDVEFGLGSTKKNLVVSEEETAYYTFRLSEKVIEKSPGAMKKAKAEANFEMGSNAFLALIILGQFVLGICWLVFRIKGKKHQRSKRIAKLFSHLFFSNIGLLIGYGIFGTKPDSFWIIFLFAGFPCGVSLVFPIGGNFLAGDSFGKGEGKKITYEYETRETPFSIFAFAIILIIGFLVGIVAMPIVIIKDIVKIVKTPK